MRRRATARSSSGRSCSSWRSALARPFTSTATEHRVHRRARLVSIVVALYVFVGNSGVLSFGQISFFAVGAYSAGEHDRPGRHEGGRAPTSSRCSATTRSETPRRSSSPLRRSHLRAPRRDAADAALGSRRRGSRPSRCSRSPTTSCELEEDRPRGRPRCRACPRRPTSGRRRSARSSSCASPSRYQRSRSVGSSARRARTRSQRRRPGSTCTASDCGRSRSPERSRVRRRAVGALPGHVQHRPVPRAHIPDARDARRRRRRQPLGRGASGRSWSAGSTRSSARRSQA